MAFLFGLPSLHRSQRCRPVSVECYGAGVSEGEIEAMAAAMAPQVEPAAVADEEEWPGLGSATAPAPAATLAAPPSAWDDEEVI